MCIHIIVSLYLGSISITASNSGPMLVPEKKPNPINITRERRREGQEKREEGER